MEEFKDKKIPNDSELGRNQELINELGKKGLGKVIEQYVSYRSQLFTYLSSYTSGDMHTRVVSAQEDDVFDVYRDITCKGRDRNNKRMIAMKSSILMPQDEGGARVEAVEQLEIVWAKWKQEQRFVTQWDKTFLTEDHQKTILMTFMPKAIVPHMREHYKDDKLLTYNAFEQEMFDNIAEKKLNEEPLSKEGKG